MEEDVGVERKVTRWRKRMWRMCERGVIRKMERHDDDDDDEKEVMMVVVVVVVEAREGEETITKES